MHAFLYPMLFMNSKKYFFLFFCLFFVASCGAAKIPFNCSLVGGLVEQVSKSSTQDCIIDIAF